jgi:phenylpropionate dioxygenase-like ring-hydroxylating dioxygenase large terminal subunit
MTRLDAAALVPGRVVAIEVGGVDFVAWRTQTGHVYGVPRWCPHLDHDLVEGYVTGEELVCAGHGWAFDGRGHAFKRNEFGRVDPKGTVAALHVCETDDGVVELDRA